jgi:lysozyme
VNSSRLKAQLTTDEGNRAKPYPCSEGKLTIGVGRNLDDRGLRPDEIQLMLSNDIAESAVECRKLFRNFDRMSEVRQEVLVNMAFNLGFNRLSGFKKLIAAIHASDWSMAAVQMLDSKWAQQVGKRAQRLAAAMQSGEF